MKLYTYFRSSTAFRVRIALNLKGLSAEHVPIHLMREGGEQNKPSYRAVNPLGRVPAIVVEGPNGPVALTQSLAILEYLDEIKPIPPLLPRDPILRAKSRAAAQLVACDIHPLNNLVTIAYLKGPMAQPQEAVDRWYAHWIREGFAVLEQMVEPGPFCFGSAPTLADLCLAPQMFNARRFKVPVDDFPQLIAITEACMKITAFDQARPEKQADAE